MGDENLTSGAKGGEAKRAYPVRFRVSGSGLDKGTLFVHVSVIGGGTERKATKMVSRWSRKKKPALGHSGPTLEERVFS